MLSNPNMTTECSLQTQKIVPKESLQLTYVMSNSSRRKTLLQYNLINLKIKKQCNFFSSCIQTLPILTLKKANFTLRATDWNTQKAHYIHASCKSFWCVLQIHCPLVYLVCASMFFCVASFPTSFAFLVASYMTSPVLLLNVLTPSFNLSCFHHHDPKWKHSPHFQCAFCKFSLIIIIYGSKTSSTLSVLAQLVVNPPK